MKNVKKGHTKVHTMYTMAAKKDQEKGLENKKYFIPQTKPNQSMKSNKDIDITYKQLGPRKQTTQK